MLYLSVNKLAKVENIGVGVVIDPAASFTDLEYLEIGDYSYIGPNVRVIGGRLAIGDYSKIHNNAYIYAKSGITLGHCTWIGQGTHLDGTGGIIAGDFLGVGINSALYSHIRHGDTLEGCKYEKNGSLLIGDDVWFVGMCLVSPVVVADKSMAMLGSVITKSMAPNSVYGGNPAIDLTPKLGAPWSDVPLEEKIKNFKALKDSFFETHKAYDPDSIQFGAESSSSDNSITYYSIPLRRYTKRKTEVEVAFNRWIFGYKAKFTPFAE
jgi:acetyltransferase-like isoleucine patch superfamily enzyme